MGEALTSPVKADIKDTVLSVLKAEGIENKQVSFTIKKRVNSSISQNDFIVSRASGKGFIDNTGQQIARTSWKAGQNGTGYENGNCR